VRHMPPHSTTAAKGLSPDGRLRSGKLAGKTMWGAIFVLSWPILVESYLNSFVGLVDTMLAARISVAATDAIAPASYFMWFISLISMALGVGATALVARSVGRGRFAVANAAVGQTVLLALSTGVVAGLLLALGAGSIGRLVGLRDEALEGFTLYMQVLGAGVPFSSMVYAGVACLRGAGDAKAALVAMSVINLVNVLASWWASGVTFCFVHTRGGCEHAMALPFQLQMGVSGIAMGTLIAHAVGAALVFRILWSGRSGVTLKRRRVAPHWHTMRRLIRVGFPNFLETTGMWLGNFLIVMLVGWLALTPGAAEEGVFGSHIIAIRVEALSFLPGFSIGAAAATLVGQYLGAGSPEMARQAIRRCVLVGAMIMGLMGVAFVTIPEAIVMVLSPQREFLETVPPLLVICGIVQVPFAVNMVVRGALRGAGDVRVVMWITWTATYGVRLPLVYLLSGVDVPLPDSLGGGVIENPSPWAPSLAGVWLGLCLEICVRAGAFTVRFMQDGWTNLRV